MPAERPVWKGQLRLSLVTCPVRIYAAARRGARISFNLLHKDTHNRINMRPHDPELGPVERGDLVKGYQYEKGRYVVLDAEDFERVKVDSAQAIVVERFVELGEVDPVYFEAPYYVVPDGAVAQETFAVLHEAMRQTGKAALSRIVLSGREHPILFCVRDRGFLLSALRAADEVKDPQDYFGDLPDAKPDTEMLALAVRLIEQKVGRFDPSSFVDRYEEALMKVIEAKIRGERPVFAEEPRPSNVVNLMDALRRSLHASGGAKPPAKSKSRRSPPAAKKKAAGRRRKAS